MRNKEGDGIVCDYCSMQVRGDFTYYSLDIYNVSVTRRIKDISQSPSVSVDFCESCMDLYREQIKKAYRPPAPNQFSCDVSGEVIRADDFNYGRCLVSKVDVVLSSAQFKCNGCSKPRDPKEGPCSKCTGEFKLIKDADVSVDDKYLEFNFSNTMLGKFRDHLEKVKKIGASEWSAQ